MRGQKFGSPVMNICAAGRPKNIPDRRVVDASRAFRCIPMPHSLEPQVPNLHCPPRAPFPELLADGKHRQERRKRPQADLIKPRLNNRGGESPCLI